MSSVEPGIEGQLAYAEIAPRTSTQDEIELRAYKLWQTRMRHGIEGTADQDWLMAEKEFSLAPDEREASNGRLHASIGTDGH